MIVAVTACSYVPQVLLFLGSPKFRATEYCCWLTQLSIPL